MTHCKSCEFFELPPHGEVPWRKKNFTLLHRLAFCLRIVLKYRIEVFKALDLFTFHFSNFGFTFRKIKVVVVVVDENPVHSQEEGGGGGGDT